MVAMLVLAAGLTLGASTASAGVLDVTLAGPGAGAVTSSPSGINCSNVPGAEQTACSHDFGFVFATGQLTATPGEGWAFTSWSGVGAGGCSSGNANPCTTALLFGNQSVTATFVAAPDGPIATTGAASNVEFPRAQVAGSVNPDNDNFPITDCYFEYGLTTDYGEKAACTPKSIAAGTSPVAVTASVGVLEPSKIYHYRLVASNAGGPTRGEDRTFTSAPAPDDACPNAAIRAQQGALAQRLPNCGAYEMVTPLFSAGQRAGAGPATADGNRSIIASVGGFAGVENLTDIGSTYVTERTDSGWKTFAIAPPASQFPYIGSGRTAVDYTRDGDRSLWFVNLKADEGTDRFTPIVREPDGAFRIAGLTQEEPGNVPGVTSGDLRTVVQATTTRPALTDGTVDSRITTKTTGPVKSLYASTRGPDGQLSVHQVAYRAGATMFPTCEVGMGGPNVLDHGSILYNQNSISSDGQKLFFSTVGGSECAEPGVRRVWAKIGDDDPIDLSASQCPATCGPEKTAHFRGASRDGSRVYFSTEQRLLPEDQNPLAGPDPAQNDLYEYDFNASGQKLRLVTGSTDPAGTAIAPSGQFRVSEDGAYVYFVARGRALAGENNRGVSPQPNGFNLYVHHRAAGQADGTTTFIGALVSLSELFSHESSTGRYFVLQTTRNLTGERVAGDVHNDVYRYDAVEDELLRVWTNDPAHNGPSRLDGATVPTSSSGNAGLQRSGSGGFKRGLMVSDDGSIVGFETKEPLSPDDRNTATDAYLWEATGRITMLTDGTSRPRNQFSGSGFNGMTPSGDSLFVSSASPLLREHTSGQNAGYVIRRDGGFPEQAPPAEPCSGDGCQGPAAAPPVPPAVRSVDPPGAGNAPALKPLTISKSKGRAARRVGRLRIRVPAAGRLVVGGPLVRNRRESAAKARTVTVKVALNRKAKRRLARTGKLTVRVRVVFSPRAGGSVSKVVRLTFKQPQMKKKGGR
jgi:hypothetical protein